MIHFPIVEDLGADTACMTEEKDGPISDPSTLCTLMGLDRQALRIVRQVHGSTVIPVGHVIEEPPRQADGMVTREPGILMAISIADCAPLYLFDPGAGVAGLIHAGREGTRKGIASVALDRMKSLGAAPENVHAFIGPSAGPCCYEVSTEIARASKTEGLAVEGRCIDLWRSNVTQLVEAGVPNRHITVSGHCTICKSGFHSYRGGCGSARNAAVFGL